MDINGNHHLFKDIPYIHNVFLKLTFIKKTLKLRVFFFVSNVHCTYLASKHIMQVPKISHSHRATNYYYYYM